jgi:hypothetical protein
MDGLMKDYEMQLVVIDKSSEHITRKIIKIQSMLNSIEKEMVRLKKAQDSNIHEENEKEAKKRVFMAEVQLGETRRLINKILSRLKD